MKFLSMIVAALIVSSTSAAEFNCTIRGYKGIGKTTDELSPTGKYILTRLDIEIRDEGIYAPWTSHIAVKNLDGSLVEGSLTDCDIRGVLNQENCPFTNKVMNQKVKENQVKFKHWTGNDTYKVKLSTQGNEISAISVNHYLYDSLTNLIFKNKNNKFRCVRK
jgi:hypothetical protein